MDIVFLYDGFDNDWFRVPLSELVLTTVWTNLTSKSRMEDGFAFLPINNSGGDGKTFLDWYCRLTAITYNQFWTELRGSGSPAGRYPELEIPHCRQQHISEGETRRILGMEKYHPSKIVAWIGNPNPKQMFLFNEARPCQN